MTFTDEQYAALDAEMRTSASVGVPILLRWLTENATGAWDLTAPQGWAPNRVVDVGCGPGWWARLMREQFCTEALGIDGFFGGRAIREADDPQLRYIEADLTRLMPADVKRWDLAVCFEVAEHLTVDQAEPFTATLRELAPVVVFSAAIPGQGGIGHVNEQWPDWWAQQFRTAGWKTSGVIRDRLWSAFGLAPYYAQNMFVAWQLDALDPNPRDVGPVQARVHPAVWSHVTGRG